MRSLRRFVVVALVLLGGCKRPDLVHRVQAKLAAAMPDAKVEIVDEATLRVKRDGHENTVSLDNVKLFCATDARQCDTAMDHLVASVAETSRGLPPIDRKNVRAVLKSRAAIDDFQAIVAKSPPEKRAGNAPCSEPFGADLFVVLVMDMPNGIGMLRHEDMEKLGLDFAQARALAQTNLAAALTTLPMDTVAPGILRIHPGDDYEAARLLVPQLWNDVARRVEGDLLVIAPNRQTVLATGSKDAGAVARMKALAAKSFAAESYPLSTAMFRRSDKGFVVATPETTTP